SADHLSGLIDGILDISKIEAGRLYLSRDEVRLSEFLDQLVGMFRVQAAAKGIDFIFKRPSVLPLVVYGDEKRLRQVLINLLSEVTNPTRIAPVEAPIFGYHGPRKTILITDDDPTHRDLLREVLAPLGFILLSAPDGPGCLALAQHCRPDLFLLDISMAGMDGWTVAETLRASGHHQARILMVSASALEAHGAPLAQPFHDG